MSILESLYDFVFGKDIDQKIHFGHEYIPPAIAMVYVLFCKWIGPALMSKRKPFNLKYMIIVYNFTQVFFNSYVVLNLIRYLNGSWKWVCLGDDAPAYELYLKRNRLLIWHIHLIKFTDLLDTIFYVLRKNNHQITFLHVFHHAVVFLFSYFTGRTADFGYHVLLSACINSFVHVIMYMYYALAAFGPGMQKFLWWKKYLTTIQIIQFIVILVYTTLNFAYACEKPGKIDIFYYIFVVCILILFIKFYRKSYKKE